MKELFSTTKQKILLVVNVIVILLYFILDVAGIALFVTPEFNTLWKFISIIFPWIVIYFTAPRTNNGYKFTVCIWSAILIFYYIYNGNVQIKGNEYIHSLAGGTLIADELRLNMIIAIVLSCLAFVSGLGILYRIKEKKKIAESKEKDLCTESVEKKVEETIKNYDICIFDAATHTLRKEKKDIDIAKFPPSKFADNDTYYAIETFRDGKKVRIYHTKDNWNKQIEIGISEEEK